MQNKAKKPNNTYLAYVLIKKLHKLSRDKVKFEKKKVLSFVVSEKFNEEKPYRGQVVQQD